MNVVSLFSGIGGIDEAFRRAGHTVVAAVEIDPAARKVLARHFPETELHDDVTTFDTSRYPNVDAVVGGWPCQDLSVAGRRAGLAGARSGLFWEFMRIVAETRPRWVLGENVPGLLSSAGGRDMGAVVGALGDLGYGWAYRVLDAQHFGVPQRRRRVFVVGCAGNRAAPVQVLFEPESSGRDTPPGRAARAGTASAANGGVARALTAQRGQRNDPNGQDFIVNALTRNGLGGGGPDDNLAQGGHLIVTPLARRGRASGSELEAGPSGGPYNALCAGDGSSSRTPLIQITHTLTSGGADASEDGAGRGTPLVAFHVTQDPISGDVSPALSAGNAQGCGTIGVLTPPITAVMGGNHAAPGSAGMDELAAAVALAENQHGELRTTGIASSLSSGGGKPGQGYSAALQGGVVRRLTPTECERLQGFPDGWTEGHSDSQRYRMLGNAVALPVVEWIAQRITAAEPEAAA